MPMTVKKVVLWRKEIENQPGTMAAALEPLAAAGVDLKVLMGYRYTGGPAKAAIELFPVVGKKALAAARAAGLEPSVIPALLVEGDDKPGMGAATARAIADAGINLAFFVAQVVGRKYSAVIGFDTEEDARKATMLIKKVSAPKNKKK